MNRMIESRIIQTGFEEMKKCKTWEARRVGHSSSASGFSTSCTSSSRGMPSEPICPASGWPACSAARLAGGSTASGATRPSSSASSGGIRPVRSACCRRSTCSSDEARTIAARSAAVCTLDSATPAQYNDHESIVLEFDRVHSLCSLIEEL